MGITVLLMATITFKVTEAEARHIRASARKQRLTVSEYLRRQSGAPFAVSRKPGKVRCAFTGAMIFSGAPGQAPLTTESVRQMLADFP